MLGWAACVGPGLASWEVSVLVHPSQGQPHFLVHLEGKSQGRGGRGAGAGHGGDTEGSVPRSCGSVGARRLSLISAKRLLPFVGKDCSARRQETTLQTSHWTLTVSPSHTLHVTPKADRASSQPNLLSGSHWDCRGPGLFKLHGPFLP